MIRFRMLGGVELLDEGGRELRSVLVQPKRLALLAYLACTSEGRFCSRETLFGVFWPELDAARARAALNQSLYYLRRELGAGMLIGRGTEEVGIDPKRLWCDVTAFARALERREPARAVELYRGDLLAGLFPVDTVQWEQWLDAERTRLRGRAVEAAWSLAEAAESEGRLTDAAQWGERALTLSDDDELCLRRLVALLDRVGDRAGAIRVYEEYSERVARDYDLEVSPETQELIAEVRSRRTAGDLVEASPRAVTGGSRGRVEAPPAGGALDSRRPIARRRRPALLGGLVAAIALLTVALFLPWRSDDGAGEPSAASTEQPAGSVLRVAVMPFATSSREPDNVHLAEGLTEGLIKRLSRLIRLRVIAHRSVMSYRNTDKSVAEVGRDLDVSLVVQGSIRWGGDRARIAVRLIDVRNQQHLLWSQEYEAGLEQLLDVEMAIAEGVAEALPLEFPPEERRRLAQAGTDEPEAHRHYLRGRYMLAQGDAEAFDRARHHFERALETDPAYALAWSGLSDAYDRLYWVHALPASAAYPRSRAAAERALEQDPDLAEAHASLARALTTYYWDSESAERHFRRAIKLDPSNAEAHRMYSAHLRNHGRFEAARAAAETAIKLDPLAFFSHFELVLLEFMERRFDEAIERARRLVAVSPRFPMARFILARAYVEKGQYEAALDELEQVEQGGSTKRALTLRAYIQGATGRHDEARKTLERLKEHSAGDLIAFNLAVVHLGLGETDRALGLLQTAIEQRDPAVRLLKEEPMFDALRSEARFEDLLEQAGYTR